MNEIIWFFLEKEKVGFALLSITSLKNSCSFWGLCSVEKEG